MKIKTIMPPLHVIRRFFVFLFSATLTMQTMVDKQFSLISLTALQNRA